MFSSNANSAPDEVNIYSTPTPSFEDHESDMEEGMERPRHPKRVRRILHGFSSPIVDWGNLFPLPLLPYLEDDKLDMSLEPRSAQGKLRIALQMKKIFCTVEQGALYTEYKEQFDDRRDGSMKAENNEPSVSMAKRQGLETVIKRRPLSQTVSFDNACVRTAMAA